jgi:SSS family solute:Na+ symporter
MLLWAPCVLIGVWATTELAGLDTSKVAANQVLAVLVRSKAGSVLGGFLTAGILAAIMSSLDSQFLCLGTIFTNDIALHYSKRPFTDRQRTLIARLFIIAIVAVTYAFSLAEPRRVFQMGVWCFSGFSALFPLVVAALYWRRLTAAGAFASILTAALSWGYLFWKSGFGLIPNYSVDIPTGEGFRQILAHYVGSASSASATGVLEYPTYPTMPVATIVLASTVAMILVSLLTRPPKEEVLARFFEVQGEPGTACKQ